MLAYSFFWAFIGGWRLKSIIECIYLDLANYFIRLIHFWWECLNFRKKGDPGTREVSGIMGKFVEKCGGVFREKEILT